MNSSSGGYHDPFAGLHGSSNGPNNHNAGGGGIPPNPMQTSSFSGTPQMMAMSAPPASNVPSSFGSAGAMGMNQRVMSGLTNASDDETFGDFASATSSVQPKTDDEEDFGDFEDAQQFSAGAAAGGGGAWAQQQQQQAAFSQQNMMSNSSNQNRVGFPPRYPDENPMMSSAAPQGGGYPQQQQQQQQQPMYPQPQQPLNQNMAMMATNGGFQQQQNMQQQHMQQQFVQQQQFSPNPEFGGFSASAPSQQQQQQQQEFGGFTAAPPQQQQQQQQQPPAREGFGSFQGGNGGLPAENVVQEQQQRMGSNDSSLTDRPPSMVMGRMSVVSTLTNDDYDDAFAGLEPAQTEWAPAATLTRISAGGEDDDDDDGEDDDFGDFDSAPAVVQHHHHSNDNETAPSLMGEMASVDYSKAETAPANLAGFAATQATTTTPTAAAVANSATATGHDDDPFAGLPGQESDNTVGAAVGGKTAEATAHVVVETASDSEEEEESGNPAAHAKKSPSAGVLIEPASGDFDRPTTISSQQPLNEEDEFGDFGGASQQAVSTNNTDDDPFAGLPAQNAVTRGDLPAEVTQPIPATVEDEEDEFGDFGGAATATAETHEFGDFGGVQATGADDGSDPFAGLPGQQEHDAAGLPSTTGATVPQTDNEHEEFGDFGGASVLPQSDSSNQPDPLVGLPKQPQQGVADEDEFGDFGGAPQTPLGTGDDDDDPFAGLPGQQPDSALQGLESTPPSETVEEHDDEFGDFGGAAPAEPESAESPGLPVTSEGEDPFAGLPAHEPDANLEETEKSPQTTEEANASKTADNDADDDEFGDFGEASSAPQNDVDGQSIPIVADHDDPFAGLPRQEPDPNSAGSEAAPVAQENGHNEDSGDSQAAISPEPQAAQPTFADYDPFAGLPTQEPESALSGVEPADEDQTDSRKEEFGDFGGASTEPPSGSPTHTDEDPFAGLPRHEPPENDDEFGDFGGASAEADQPLSADDDPFSGLPGQESTPQTDSGPPPLAANDGARESADAMVGESGIGGGDDDDDDFGDFGVASLPGMGVDSPGPHTADDEFGDFGSAELPKAAIASTMDTSTNGENDSDFELIEHPTADIPLDDSPNASKDNAVPAADGDDEFGDFHRQGAEATNGAEPGGSADGEFGDFGSAEANDSTIQVQAKDPGETDGGDKPNDLEPSDKPGDLEPSAEGLDASKDFGDFGSAENGAAHLDNAGEDDFGDFGSAEATPNDATIQPKEADSAETEGDSRDLKAPAARDGADFGSAENEAAQQSAGNEDFGSAEVKLDDAVAQSPKELGTSETVGADSVKNLQAPAGDVNPGTPEPANAADDEFGDFGSAEVVDADAGSAIKPPTTDGLESAQSGGDGDDEQFGDFGSAEMNEATDFGDFGSAEVDDKAQPAAIPVTSEDTSDLSGGSGPPQSQATEENNLETIPKDVRDDDDDFGDFGSAPADNSQSAQAGASADEADDFGDFGSAPKESPKEEATDAQGGGTLDNNDGDDDFGDFDSAPEEPAPQPQPQQANVAATVAVPVENTLVYKLTKMSFEKLFGKYLATDARPADKADKSHESLISIESFLESLSDEQPPPPPPDQCALKSVLVQMNRQPSAEHQILYSVERVQNPFFFPADGFRSLDLSSGSRQPLSEDKKRNLPDVLDVKLLSASDMAQDMASPEIQPRRVVEPQEATVVDVPPVGQPKTS